MTLRRAAKTPDDKFFLRYFFSNLLFASDLVEVSIYQRSAAAESDNWRV